MANPDPLSFAAYIALRYVSMGKRNQLVSFMSALSIFGLALGITLLVTVLSVMNGFDREVRENILGIIPHMKISTDEAYTLENWEAVEQRVLALPGVRGVAPLIERTGVVARDDYSHGILVNGVDPKRETSFSRLERFMQTGSLASLADERWGVVLGATLAGELGVTVGDRVDLFSLNVSVNPLTPLPSFRAFTVVGVYRVGTLELDRDLVVINSEAARLLFRLRSPYTSLRVQVQDVLNADQLRSRLLEVLPDDMQITSWTQLFGSIYENIRFSRTVIGLMLWLLIAVAAFNLVVSLIMVVRDKQGDIAILRTLGASPGTINRIFMLQGSLVGVVGIAIGLTLGIGGSLWVGDLARFIESTFSIQLLNAEVYPIDFLPSQIRLSDLLTVALGVLVLSLLATLYPARRAAAIQPAEALRLE